MKRTGKRGFTIIELLTVMAIIAVLIGLLVPALNLVKDHAKEIQQRAQFHSIDVGLEMFKSEFGSYPDSHENALETVVTPQQQDPKNYCGAEKLAEALVGWDLLGVHPKTGFRSDGTNYFAATGQYEIVYNTEVGLDLGTTYVEPDGAANVKARKGPMVDLENANAYRIGDVYGTAYGNFDPDNFVLCDVFAKKRTSAVKTGMPILYFKARINYQFQDYTDTTDNGNDIYNYDDNRRLVELGRAETVFAQHELDFGGTPYAKFEKMILNNQVNQATITTTNSTGIKRPYRADTYIMVSAGKDGNYGTADDIFNFETGVTE